ncbi:helix-turn-helix domain-containing protein [Planktotalea sp.]|uniref:helix-turn-helix domain-containing protein n=1 Tax=Planktotalea sp. TaxID=2029877 RepID=UPI003D6B967B
MTNETPTAKPTMPPIAVAPNEAARLAGVGRTTLYAALAKGDLKSLKIGTRRLIKVSAIHEWLHQNEQRNDG